MNLGGIDGTSQGWCLTQGTWHDNQITQVGWLYMGHITQLDVMPPFQALTINLPIGLPITKKDRRACDKQVKQLLGNRVSSLFQTPCRSSLTQTDPETLASLGLTKQTQHILPKVKELNDWMTPEKQRYIKETNPELLFVTLAESLPKNTRLMSKKKDQGIHQRIQLLQTLPLFQNLPLEEIIRTEKSHHPILKVPDMIDSLACLAIAGKMVEGSAQSIPETPQQDDQGFYPSIWF